MIKSFGDWSDGGTPGHISNPVVKPVSADGTWGADPWESRSSPKDFFFLMGSIISNPPTRIDQAGESGPVGCASPDVVTSQNLGFTSRNEFAETVDSLIL